MIKRIFVLVSVLSNIFLQAQNKYDIAGIYSGKDVQYENVKVVNSFDNVEDAKLLLFKSELDEGVYEVTVTRKATNIYQIDGTEIYIQTKFCYVSGIRQKAILKINSKYSYNKGEIIF